MDSTDATLLSTGFDSLEINNKSSKIEEEKQPLPPCCAIICDAWYGFPSQKRPRKERILAVSKQIHNFICWRRSAFRKEKEKEKLKQLLVSHVYVIGKGIDVDCIKERVLELESMEGQEDSRESIRSGKEKKLNRCTFLPDKKLEDLSVELSNEKTLGKNDNVLLSSSSENRLLVSYLSPDANVKLNASGLPPRVVIVGMLVDRKVQPNRSRNRAESIKMVADPRVGHGDTATADRDDRDVNSNIEIVPSQLPLDALNVTDLSEDEPLNIDTVMEIMERWWNHSYGGIVTEKGAAAITHKNRGGATSGGSSVTDAQQRQRRIQKFQDAAARALLTHRQRHPKRVIHGGASEKCNS